MAQANTDALIQEAIAAAQAVEQQNENQSADSDKLAEAFRKAAPLLKALEVIKNNSSRKGLFRRHMFNFKAEKRADFVRITTTVQFFREESSKLSINVHSNGDMTVLYNDPGKYKGGAINGTEDVIRIVANGAKTNGLIR